MRLQRIPNPEFPIPAPVVMFFALLFVAAAIAGATAFVIFWPLALVHLRDRHPDVKARLGDGAFLKPDALWWLFSGRYRQVRDGQFTGLATPARVDRKGVVVGKGVSVRVASGGAR